MSEPTAMTVRSSEAWSPTPMMIGVESSPSKINRTLIPQLPFADVNGYYIDQVRQLIALPLNYRLTSPSPFVAWDYGNGTTQSFVSPLTYEPGNLSKTYGFLFGGNSTIYANLDGGGGILVNVQRQQTSFQALAMIGPQTGGVTSLWVNDPNGNLIVNETLTPNTEPPSPSGYYGSHELLFPMSANGTYQFGITNSWGVSSVFQTYDNVAHVSPPPNEEYFLMTFFGFLVVGLYLGKIFRERTQRTQFSTSTPQTTLGSSFNRTRTHTEYMHRIASHS